MPSDEQADLRAVRGIGPKAEARLKQAGVTDLATLARTPVNELAAALSGLRGKFDAERIDREQWINQATVLAAAVSRSGPGPGPERDTAQPVRHGFTVEVQVAQAGRQVLATRITHAPTGDEEAWGGWDPQRLTDFIRDRSGLRSPASASPEPASPEPTAHGGPPASGSPASPRTTAAAADGRGARPERLRAYAMVPAAGPGATGGRSRALTANLTFSPAPLKLTGITPATVRAEVVARQLLTGGGVVVGQGSASMPPRGLFQLEVPCDLSAAQRPLVLCALVRVLAADDQDEQPVQELTGARLQIRT
jgi:hypothetical protein